MGTNPWEGVTTARAQPLPTAGMRNIQDAYTETRAWKHSRTPYTKYTSHNPPIVLRATLMGKMCLGNQSALLVAPSRHTGGSGRAAPNPFLLSLLDSRNDLLFPLEWLLVTENLPPPGPLPLVTILPCNKNNQHYFYEVIVAINISALTRLFFFFICWVPVTKNKWDLLKLCCIFINWQMLLNLTLVSNCVNIFAFVLFCLMIWTSNNTCSSATVL